MINNSLVIICFTYKAVTMIVGVDVIAVATRAVGAWLPC